MQLQNQRHWWQKVVILFGWYVEKLIWREIERDGERQSDHDVWRCTLLMMMKSRNGCDLISSFSEAVVCVLLFPLMSLLKFCRQSLWCSSFDGHKQVKQIRQLCKMLVICSVCDREVQLLKAGKDSWL